MTNQLRVPGVYVDTDYPENAATVAALKQMEGLEPTAPAPTPELSNTPDSL
jgi:hypothetical protein